jgi:hypothetical protein
LWSASQDAEANGGKKLLKPRVGANNDALHLTPFFLKGNLDRKLPGPEHHEEQVRTRHVSFSHAALFFLQF